MQWPSSLALVPLRQLQLLWLELLRRTESIHRALQRLVQQAGRSLPGDFGGRRLVLKAVVEGAALLQQAPLRTIATPAFILRILHALAHGPAAAHSADGVDATALLEARLAAGRPVSRPSTALRRQTLKVRVSHLGSRVLGMIRMVCGELASVVIRLIYGQVQQFRLAGLEQHVPDDTEAQIHDLLEVLVGLELPQDLLLGVETEVLGLHLGYLVEMVLELVMLDLIQILFAQYHVLDQLRDLLVELDDVRLSVHEVLHRRPLLELGVLAAFLRTASEGADESAEDLGRDESRVLRLLYSQDIGIDV